MALSLLLGNVDDNDNDNKTLRPFIVQKIELRILCYIAIIHVLQPCSISIK